MRNIDRSSWVSWACYYFGVILAWGPELHRDVVALRSGFWLLLSAILAFLAIVVLLQRHMQISLSSASFGKPVRLFTGGIFRWSRNPIYLAFLLPLSTLAYYSVPACIAATVLYLVSMTYFVIAREETVLSHRFGDEFASYCGRTPRWLFV